MDEHQYTPQYTLYIRVVFITNDKYRAMATPNHQQFALLHNKYWELREENEELKIIVQEKVDLIARLRLEKDELIARLRRDLNVANHKVAKLEQLVDPEMLIASKS